MSEIIEYYPWQRNEIKIKNSETSIYSGNVIGNISKEERINAVFALGNSYVADINELGDAFDEQIAPGAAKYIALWKIINDVESAITAYFGDN